MFALTGDDLAKIIQGFDTQTLIIVGGIAALWAGKLLPAGLWGKLKSLIPKKREPLWPTVDPPDAVDDLEILIHQMRLLTCDEAPNIREGIAKHLDEIELLAGTKGAGS